MKKKKEQIKNYILLFSFFFTFSYIIYTHWIHNLFEFLSVFSFNKQYTTLIHWTNSWRRKRLKKKKTVWGNIFEKKKKNFHSFFHEKSKKSKKLIFFSFHQKNTSFTNVFSNSIFQQILINLVDLQQNFFVFPLPFSSIVFKV